jgi:high affinity Mn2+ porin
MYNNPFWTVKIAGIMEPKTANGLNLDAHLNKAFGLAFETDKNYSLSGMQGTARFLIFLNKARMGNYQEALNNPLYNLDITQTEVYSSTKYGLALNLSQKFSNTIGGFLRLSWNDGKNETWAFTEIDHALSCGVVIDHLIKGRNDDQFGIALAINGISQDHRNYIAAGGLGFMIGDGKLNYGNEIIVESFYKLQFASYISISPDYQFVINPAYNKDRGPVHIFGIRVHTEF